MDFTKEYQFLSSCLNKNDVYSIRFHFNKCLCKWYFGFNDCKNFYMVLVCRIDNVEIYRPFPIKHVNNKVYFSGYLNNFEYLKKLLVNGKLETFYQTTFNYINNPNNHLLEQKSDLQKIIDKFDSKQRQDPNFEDIESIYFYCIAHQKMSEKQYQKSKQYLNPYHVKKIYETEEFTIRFTKNPFRETKFIFSDIWNIIQKK